MKIAMVSEHASPLAAIDGLGGADAGGQNVFVADLAAELGRQGHHVTVYTRRDAAGLPSRVRLAPGVTVEHVPAGPPEPVPKDRLLPYMPDFGRYLAERWSNAPPDIAHAHFWMSGLAAIQAADALTPRLPVVQTYHALGTVKRRHQGGKDTSPPGRIRLERAIGRTADAVIATCSDETGELIRMGVPRNRITVVPCGVDLEGFGPGGPATPANGRPRLVALSRLVERKGVDTAIEALVRVPKAELLVAGGPPKAQLDGDAEVRRLRGVAAAAGVTGRVSFLGRVGRRDVPELLRSADLVVTLPWYEPFGMVPLEAMACGVPVVATGVGGHVDTVIDRVTGVHVPPRRAVQAATCIRELLADPALRAAMGVAGADRARSCYSWERIGRDTVSVYSRAMARCEVPV
ncbi:glycosyltransferase [Actinomadura sp. 6N118]|uniref:glycosyltransferase n=1 Tax=Actinomadura sp. 6N118 TaxID=3375151 RepID=UPI0037B6EB63